MANYFQDPSQSFVPSAMYKPNFDALQMSLMTSQSKYDAGLAGVQSAYNSVLNAPLTKNENADVRQQYIKDATKQLQDLGGVDLSIESNQLQARGVFNNFFKDTEMQNDMVYTKSQNQQINAFQNFKPDKEKPFEYADQRSLQDMQSGMNKVRTSKRGDDAVYQVRQFTPFTNIIDETAQAVVDQKIAVKSVNNQGVVSYEQTNGPQSLGNWTTMVAARLQDSHFAQFQVEARYAQEQGTAAAKADIKYRTGQDVSDKEALQYYFENNIHNSFTQYSDQLTSLKDEQVKLAKKDSEFPTDGSSADFDALQKRIQENAAALSSTSKEADKYDPTKNSYATTLNNFMSNPAGELFKIVKNNYIKNTAAYFSANQKTEIGVANPELVEIDRRNKQGFDMQLAKNKDAREERQQKVDEINAGVGTGDQRGTSGATGSGLNADGSVMTAAEKKAANNLDYENPQHDGKIGNNYVDIDLVKKYNDEQSTRFNLIKTTTLNADGIASILATQSGGTLSYADIVQFTSALKSDIPESKYTLEQKAIKEKVVRLFANNNIPFNASNSNSIADSVSAFASNYFNMIKDSKEKWDAKTVNIWRDSQVVDENLTTYLSLRDAKDKGVIAELAKDKPNLVVHRNDGTQTLVDATDLEKDLSGLSPHLKAQLGKDYAKDYLNGKVGYRFTNLSDEAASHAYTDIKGLIGGAPATTPFRFNGSKGYFIKNGNNDEVNITNPHDIAQLNSFEQKWGKSPEIGKSFTKANNAVLPSLPSFGKNDAVMGDTFHFNMKNTPTDTDKAVKIIKQATIPGNFDLDPTIGSSANALNGLLVQKINSWGAKDIGKYMNPPVYYSNNGAPTVVLSFRPGLSNDEIAQMNVSGMSTIKDLPAKISLPLHKNDSADLQELMKPNSGQYLYEKLLHGIPKYSSPIEEGLGFKYSMVPNDATNPTSVKIIINTKQLQPDGTLLSVNPTEEILSFNDYTADQMVQKMQKTTESHMLYNQGMQKQINDKNALMTTEKETKIKLLADHKAALKTN